MGRVQKNPLRMLRLRRANAARMSALLDPPDSDESDSDEQATPKFMCVLRVPNYRDELSEILGDSDVPYLGLFSGPRSKPGDGDTSHTHPTAEDRALFKHVYKLDPRPVGSDTELKSRNQRSHMSIHFGQRYAMDAWFRSAYPAEYTRRDYMAVCSFCLEYSVSDLVAERHALKCRRRYPPGHEIYRDGDYSVWEVDGMLANLYCQNLCLLAKSFLASKTLYRDVQPFFFYVMTQRTPDGPSFIGYFSKQKIHSTLEPEEPVQNVSCIIALPFTQNLGIGQFLISFSYHLTRLQRTTGGPETPLSTLGEKAYRNYWRREVCFLLKKCIDENKTISLTTLSTRTGITKNHVLVALEDLGWLQVTDDGGIKIEVKEEEMNEMIEKYERRDMLQVNPEKLVWTARCT